MVKKGSHVFIQTVTFYFCGTVEDVSETEITLIDAAWVAETGRFNEFIAGAKPTGLEPCGTVTINRSAIVATYPLKVKIEVI